MQFALTCRQHSWEKERKRERAWRNWRISNWNGNKSFFAYNQPTTSLRYGCKCESAYKLSLSHSLIWTLSLRCVAHSNTHGFNPSLSHKITLASPSVNTLSLTRTYEIRTSISTLTQFSLISCPIPIYLFEGIFLSLLPLRLSGLWRRQRQRRRRRSVAKGREKRIASYFAFCQNENDLNK